MIIKIEQDSIQSYLTDAANEKGFCNAVYLPENEEDVVNLFTRCNVTKEQITISGNGTSLTGARVPKGGIVVSTEKLNKIIEINIEDKYIVVEPGVILSDLKNEVEQMGLFYPADPTEQNCFIGATVATNASGARSLKFGSTRNFVMSLKIVLPTGEVILLNRGEIFVVNNSASIITKNNSTIDLNIPDIDMPKTKNTAGYYCKNGMDIIDLFIGSEGTLGFISEIKLRLLPYPKTFFSTVVFFNDIELCFNTINSLLIKSGEHNLINPSALEFFDENALKMLKIDYPDIPNSPVAALWIEQDTNADEYQDLLEQYLSVFEKYEIDTDNTWFAFDKNDMVKFQKFRHSISAKVNDYIAKNNLTKFGTDLAVPHERFHYFYNSAISLVKYNELNYVAYGHFGNSHLHLNILPKDHNQIILAKQIYKQLCQLSVDLDGTVSAEHGIGKKKTDYLLMMYGEKVVKQFAGIKKVLDPNLILGIGNIIKPEFFT